MPRAALVLALLVTFSTVTAGCLGGSKDAPAPPANKTAANATIVDDGSAATAMNASLGSVPHKHDYWKGRERVTVIDGDFSLDAQNQTAFFPLFLEQRPAIGGTSVHLPDGQIVYEGTGRMEITTAWTDATITGLEMRYRTTGKPDLTEPKPVDNGKILAIDVAPEMTDEPHAQSSLWGFLYEAYGQGGAGVANGKFHMKVDIVKMRDIETFPAHPDLFLGKTFIKVLDKDMTIKSDPPQDTATNFAAHKIDAPGFAPERPIAPEAKMVLLKIEVKSATMTNPAGDPSKVTMQYRSARSAFNYRDADLAKQDGKSYVFAMKVEQGDGDGFYAKESAWRFDPVIQDQVNGQEVRCFFTDCFSWTMDVHVTAYAYKVEAGPSDFGQAPATA